MAAAAEAEAHVVEIRIPVDEKVCLAMEEQQQHPLREISQSPGHLLLLKLWQREERLLGLRMAHGEARMESLSHHLFRLCCLFLLFHALSLALLFTASVTHAADQVCRRWWLPAGAVGAASAVLAGLVQAGAWAHWRARGRLQRDRDHNRALLGCVRELRMKGASFDLSKEPHARKRMKSSSVEVKWGPLACCSRNLLPLSLLCFAGVAFAASKFLLCAFVDEPK